MKTVSTIILLTTLLCTLIIAQERILPSPKIGWDSLETRIQYPELAKRASYNSAYSVTFRVDSVGILKDVYVESFSGKININHIDYTCALNSMDSSFVQAIKAACNSLEWISSRINNKQTTMTVTIPFVFVVHSYETPISSRKIVIKETVRQKMQLNKTY